MNEHDRAYLLTTALAAIRYCQQWNIDLVAAMPDHFLDFPLAATTDETYEATAETLNSEIEWES